METLVLRIVELIDGITLPQKFVPIVLVIVLLVLMQLLATNALKDSIK